MSFRGIVIGAAVLAVSHLLGALIVKDGPARFPAIIALAVLVLGGMVGVVVWGIHSGRNVRKDPP